MLLFAAVALPFSGSRYYVDLGTLVLTYIMLGWGLNIVVGLAGLLDLGYVAFYAVGAYSYALLATNFGLGFWTCLPLAGILAGVLGCLLGFPVLRLRGDYLAIVTLAFGEIIRIVLNNWVSLTNGPNGITGIPRPTLFGLRFSMDGGDGTFAGFFNLEPATIQRVIFLYYVILGLALLTNWVSLRLRRMPLGRAWEALREDEVACRSLGINVTQHQADRVRHRRHVRRFRRRVLRHAAGVHQPGEFYFHRERHRAGDRRTGRPRQPARRRAGGHRHGRRAGGCCATFLSFLGDQMDSELFAGIASELPLYRMLIFGLALVVMMVLRPRGMVSGRTPACR